MNWFSKWYDAAPVTFIIVLSGIGLALISTIIGIVFKGFWKDKGFMEVENDKGKKVQLGWAMYSYPIVLVLHLDLSLEWVKAIRGAIKRIEIAAGQQLFAVEEPVIGYKWDLPAPPGYVSVFAKEPAGELQSDNAVTEHRYDPSTGRIRSANVIVPAICDKKMAVVLHELMHVLGFDHDESQDSIMYPRLSARRTPGVLSPDDIKRLQKL